MKKISSIWLIAFSFVPSVLIELGVLSIHAPAYANEESKPDSPTEDVVVEQPKQLEQSQVNPRVDEITPNSNDYPAYCPTISSQLKPEDFEFREALQKCRYGS